MAFLISASLNKQTSNIDVVDDEIKDELNSAADETNKVCPLLHHITLYCAYR